MFFYIRAPAEGARRIFLFGGADLHEDSCGIPSGVPVEEGPKPFGVQLPLRTLRVVELDGPAMRRTLAEPQAVFGADVSDQLGHGAGGAHKQRFALRIAVKDDLGRNACLGEAFAELFLKHPLIVSRGALSLVVVDVGVVMVIIIMMIMID